MQPVGFELTISPSTHLLRKEVITFKIKIIFSIKWRIQLARIMGNSNLPGLTFCSYIGRSTSSVQYHVSWLLLPNLADRAVFL